MTRPGFLPIGLYLTQVSKAVSRAFDDALAAAGGSVPVWLVLISLKSGDPASQRELAGSVGVQGATLTHHLNAMEAAGLVTRRRNPANRRVHIVELTAEGEALFLRLREAAAAFDRRLRTGLSDADIETVTSLLGRLRDNTAQPPQAAPDLPGRNRRVRPDWPPLGHPHSASRGSFSSDCRKNRAIVERLVRSIR